MGRDRREERNGDVDWDSQWDGGRSGEAGMKEGQTDDEGKENRKGRRRGRRKREMTGERRVRDRIDIELQGMKEIKWQGGFQSGHETETVVRSKKKE